MRAAAGASPSFTATGTGNSSLHLCGADHICCLCRCSVALRGRETGAGNRCRSACTCVELTTCVACACLPTGGVWVTHPGEVWGCCKAASSVVGAAAPTVGPAWCCRLAWLISLASFWIRGYRHRPHHVPRLAAPPPHYSPPAGVPVGPAVHFVAAGHGHHGGQRGQDGGVPRLRLPGGGHAPGHLHGGRELCARAALPCPPALSWQAASSCRQRVAAAQRIVVAVLNRLLPPAPPACALQLVEYSCAVAPISRSLESLALDLCWNQASDELYVSHANGRVGVWQRMG